MNSGGGIYLLARMKREGSKGEPPEDRLLKRHTLLCRRCVKVLEYITLNGSQLLSSATRCSHAVRNPKDEADNSLGAPCCLNRRLKQCHKKALYIATRG